MSDAMDWSQDFCLSCDNVNHTDGPYCSEACRLLDLDKRTDADPHAAYFPPAYSPALSNYTWSTASSPVRSTGLYLQPAINFSALRTTATHAGAVSLPNSPHSATSTDPYFAAAAAAMAAQHSHPSPHHSRRRASHSKRGLTTSSSRSSLSSISTASSSLHGLSDQAASQLRAYVNSFDQSREQRRRMTLA